MCSTSTGSSSPTLCDSRFWATARSGNRTSTWAFSQLLKLFPRTEFQALVKRTYGERLKRVERAQQESGQQALGGAADTRV